MLQVKFIQILCMGFSYGEKFTSVFKRAATAARLLTTKRDMEVLFI